MASILVKESVRYVNNAAAAIKDYDCTVIVGEKADESLYPEFVQSCLAAVKLMGEVSKMIPLFFFSCQTRNG